MISAAAATQEEYGEIHAGVDADVLEGAVVFGTADVALGPSGADVVEYAAAFPVDEYPLGAVREGLYVIAHVGPQPVQEGGDGRPFGQRELGPEVLEVRVDRPQVDGQHAVRDALLCAGDHLIQQLRYLRRGDRVGQRGGNHVFQGVPYNRFE